MSKKKSSIRLYPYLLHSNFAHFQKKLPSMFPDVEKRVLKQPALMLKIFWQSVIRHSPELLNTLDTLILTEEVWHKNQGSPTFLPESEDVARFLSSYGGSQLTEQSLFDESLRTFVLAIPEQGVDVPKAVEHLNAKTGLLVSLKREQDLEPMSQPFLEMLNLPAEKFAYKGVPASTLFNLSITYTTRGDHDQMRTRFTVASKDLVEWLKDPTPENFIQLMSRYERNSDAKFLGKIQLTEDEQRVESCLLKYVVGALLIQRSMPERIKRGLPNRTNMLNQDKTGLAKPTLYSITPPQSKPRSASVNTFYRQAHFRALVHERYYKGEHAHLERGSRVVFVSDTIVSRGEEIEAYTITE